MKPRLRYANHVWSCRTAVPHPVFAFGIWRIGYGYSAQAAYADWLEQSNRGQDRATR